MIRFGFDSIRIQTRRDILRTDSALAVNDPTIAWPRAHKAQELLVRTVFGQHSIGKIRPIKASDITACSAQAQLLNDVLLHALCRRCGKRHHRRFRKQFAQFHKLAIFRSKVMSPLADAMRFVYCD